MRNGVIASLLVVAILVGAGAGYLIGNVNVRISTTTSTSLALSTTTTTISESVPVLQSFGYITTAQGCATNGRYVPCLGSPAYEFNSCLNYTSGPAAPYTCTYTLKESFPPYPSYSFNITLGVLGQTGEPDGANCRVDTFGYADCIPVINSTAFIVAVPAPPPQ